MDTFGGNGAEGRGYTHGFSSEDHVEEGVKVARQYMGYSWGRSSVVISVNVVGYDLHRETGGNRSIVGSVAADI